MVLVAWSAIPAAGSGVGDGVEAEPAGLKLRLRERSVIGQHKKQLGQSLSKLIASNSVGNL